ncbi:MAG TPA: diguanylate cyclase [Thermodesulfovibrionales bacterium]|nr:diguanylate cyclase [Thermodesulfovibrionales bacterium]
MDERPSIIIVDNNEYLLPVFREMFASEGYRCETCTSAQAALELIDKIPFHVMLTDIAMPGMSGLELTEKARKLRPHMITIVMTGFIDDFSYDRAIEAGASDFIKKPFTQKEILHRLSHVRLQENLRMLSITDELTGLYNRRGFFTLAEEFLKLDRRQKKGLFLLYADLDHLKIINDTLGHQEGDLALIDVANILKETYRESDIIARIGGDEWVVLPVGTTGDNIETIIARLQKNINRHNAATKRTYALSVSLGVACYDPHKPCSIDELIARADKEMYEQKRMKRKQES